jgi:hypothetical protein
MDIYDITKNQFSAMLKDFDDGDELLTTPVAYAVTGDPVELEKLASVDFTKLRVVRHSASAPDAPEAQIWCETVATSDGGLAICVEEEGPAPIDAGDALMVAQSLN